MHAVITGSTSDMGTEVARQLKNHDWNLTLSGRNRERGQNIARDSQSTFIPADLSLLGGLPRVTCQVHKPIDARILCAGAVSRSRQHRLPPQGHQQTFTTGHQSPIVLTQLQLDHLIPGAEVLMLGGQGAVRGVSTDRAFPHRGMPAALKTAMAAHLLAAELSRRHTLHHHSALPASRAKHLWSHTRSVQQKVTRERQA